MVKRSVKKCSTCKKVQSLDNFFKCKSKTDGFQTSCKSCQIAKGRTARGKSYFRKSRLKTKYSLSVEDFEELKKSQNGVCYVCKEEKSLCVDHDHTTGKVRGLLCTDCNKALGFIKDNELYMARLINYLNKGL